MFVFLKVIFTFQKLQIGICVMLLEYEEFICSLQIQLVLTKIVDNISSGCILNYKVLCSNIQKKYIIIFTSYNWRLKLETNKLLSAK